MPIKKLLFASLLISSSVFADPVDYTFTVENVTQHWTDVSAGPDENGLVEGIELPLTNPVYPDTVSITGSFTYDASAAGRVGNLPAAPPAIGDPHPGIVLFPSITNVVLNVDTDVYTRDLQWMLFQDETAPVDPQYLGDNLPNDSLRTFLLPFNPVEQNFTITHEGIELETGTPYLWFTEGDETGFNFFPDSALSDPAVWGGPSSATLPIKLPPQGAEVQRFSLSFLDDGNPTQFNYALRGDLVVTPVIPEPEPVPVAEDYTYTIEVFEQKLWHGGFALPWVELPLINPPVAIGDTLTGGFTYDASVPPDPNPLLTAFLCGSLQLCIVNEGRRDDSLTNFSLKIADQTYTNQIAVTREMHDETDIPNRPFPPGLPYGWDQLSAPQDIFSIVKAPISPLQPNIALMHDGLAYEVLGFQLNLYEGDTGHDFFPDGDPDPAFPARLPPDGAELGIAYVSLRHEVEPEVYQKFEIEGYLKVSGPPTPVTIDVDPWSTDNEVLTNSDNPIPVAVMSSSTVNGDAVDLDTSKIDPATVKFGIGEAPNIAFPWPLDFNGDFNTDIAYMFKTQASGIFCEDTEVTLTGETYSGEKFEGAGTIDASDCETGFCHPL